MAALRGRVPWAPVLRVRDHHWQPLLCRSPGSFFRRHVSCSTITIRDYTTSHYCNTTKHSEDNTASSIFSYGEYKQLDSDYHIKRVHRPPSTARCPPT